MKILLIQPPLVYAKFQTTTPPIGLGYLASYLEESGHTVKIIDSTILNYRLKDIKKEIQIFDPDVVGVTSMTRHIITALSIIKIAKEHNPNCITVLGGPHPTVRSRETLEESPLVDVIVRGEGEKTFTELLEKKNKEEWNNVKGISFRIGDEIIENEDREPIQDLDSIPFPAYHLLPMDKYKVKLFDAGVFGSRGQSYGVIFTSRGCPFNCIFCSSREIWGKKWRFRSPENVIEEIKLLRDKYGIKVIHFWDDTFTMDKKRAIRICELIKKENIDITWICETRVDLFNEEVAKAMKEAGCILVYFGLESGVQKTLDYLEKGFKLETAEKAVNIAKKAGINVAGFFMLGIPGETKEDINKTIDFASKLDLKSVEFNLYIPFPGTKVFEMAEKNNLLLTKDWSKYEPSNPVMKLPGFTRGELKRLKRKAYYRYSLS